MTNWTKDVSNQPEVRSMVAKILVVMIVSIASMSINAYRGFNDRGSNRNEEISLNKFFS